MNPADIDREKHRDTPAVNRARKPRGRRQSTQEKRTLRDSGAG